MKKLLFVLIILSLVLVGCAKKEVATTEVVKPEESIVVVEEQPATELEVVEEAPVLEEEPIIEETPVVKEEYKVQLFATYDETKANNVANELKSKFSDEVYVEYIAPYYKVRIGHYATKAEAEKVRDMAREMGYADAFIVLP